MQRSLPFVGIVCAVAAVAVALVATRTAASVTADHFTGAIVLAALGVAAEMLSYEQAKGAASGSIAIIPFAAAGTHWPDGFHRSTNAR